jgi:hypothetical protein
MIFLVITIIFCFLLYFLMYKKYIEEGFVYVDDRNRHLFLLKKGLFVSEVSTKYYVYNINTYELLFMDKIHI